MYALDLLRQVEYSKTQYEEHKNVVRALSAFYGQHNIKMLLMKGYGSSLDYPVPEHRPTGDLDIYLFGHKERADELISNRRGISVDRNYGFHSRFQLNGVTVENHSQFFDDDRHRSDVRFKRYFLNCLMKM